jgi:hypothetical protein
MNDWQLFAVIGVPSLLTLLGMAQNNKRFEAIDKLIDATQADINLIRDDMQQFFCDLGRHEEAVDNLKSKR